MKQIKFYHPRCKHGMIKSWCAECSTNKRVKAVTKTLSKTRRKRNGEFDYSFKSKVYNTVSIAVGVALVAYSGFYHFFPIGDVQADFVSPVSDVATPGAGMFVEPTPTPDPIKDEIKKVFGEHADEAIKVFSCESTLKNVCNDGVNQNGTVDCGVPQINSIHGISRKWLLDYEISLRVAKRLFDEQGWSPWVSSYKCHKIK